MALTPKSQTEGLKVDLYFDKLSIPSLPREAVPSLFFKVGLDAIE